MQNKTHMVRFTNENLFIRAKVRAAKDMVALSELVEKAVKEYLSKKPVD